MSTRCQITVEGNPDVFIYKHSDGYPDGKHGVLAWLLPFVHDFRRERGHQPGYLVARLVGHMCVLEPGVLGIGVDTEIHGDSRYLYVVRKDGKVDVREPPRGRRGGEADWSQAHLWGTVETHDSATYADESTFKLEETTA